MKKQDIDMYMISNVFKKKLDKYIKISSLRFLWWQTRYINFFMKCTKMTLEWFVWSFV